MKRNYCFVCYSSSDALTFTKILVNKLEKEYPQITLWFDKNDLLFNSDWENQIKDALRKCCLFIFVLTPNSMAKNSYCQKEWKQAIFWKKPIILITMQKKSDLPLALIKYQMFDFSRGFKIVLKDLGEYIVRNK